MSYRADNEPEYIDDDEYRDPDAYGESDQRGSNVLGGSGSRRAGEAASDAPAEGLASGREPAFEIESQKRAKRPASSSRKKIRARNPAPAVASSEERRARLAGKKPAGRESDKPRRTRNQAAEDPAPASREGGRLEGLRARFSRGDKQSAAESERGRTRLAQVTGGIKARIGRFRDRRGGRRDSEDERSAGSRHEKSASPAFRSGGAGADSARATRDQSSERGRPRPSKTPRIESADWLDLDRKLDLIGVALVFGAIVLFLSALSAEQAAISSVNRFIGQLLGWGAIAVPITMFAIGLWLIIRHFGDEAPSIDPLRLSGAALAFLGVLILFQYFESFNYSEAIARYQVCRDPTNPACVDALVQSSYQAGRGGGFIGGWLYSALVNNLTEIGGFVVVLMVMTFGAMLITRSTMAEIAVVAIGLGRGARTRISHYAARRRAARLHAQQQLDLAESDTKVRVSKPQAARLTVGTRDARALPEPSAESRPIPVRIKEFLGRRGGTALDLAADPVPLVADGGESLANKDSVLARLFGMGKRTEAAPEASPMAQPHRDSGRPTPGALERFLNLGDDLPFSTEASPVWRKPARPTSAQAGGAPPQEPSPEPASEFPSARRQNIKPEPLEPPAPPPGEANNGSPGDGGETTAAPPSAIAPLDSAEEALDSLAEQAAADGVKIPRDERASKSAEDSAIAEEPIPEGAAEREERAEHSLAPPRPRIDWRLPAFRDLLNSGTEGELDREPLLRQAQVIEDTLASFGAPGRVVEINSGPVITQYGVEPSYLTTSTGKQNRVKVGAIAKLDKDLQLALGAKSIRVEAPVPGKGYVGIEVPNPDSARVSLRDVMESKSYQGIESPLAIALGVSVDGTPVSGDLTQMPHLLIAGTTGSGKSVCVNAIINSIIAVNSPDVVKFIMIDPKRVELTGYNGMPHLVAPVVVELERTIGVLRWVTTEMDARYKRFSQAGARNIVDFNSILDPDIAPMPYIVVIIDELADLMMMAPDDTERAITRIAALARATGIH
ncbi:MAG: DNA translocase FtsK, partial [Chloroflexi bacterium]|nr:DNA translocase FtsK [Chloroflexota bacterium]